MYIFWMFSFLPKILMLCHKWGWCIWNMLCCNYVYLFYIILCHASKYIYIYVYIYIFFVIPHFNINEKNFISFAYILSAWCTVRIIKMTADGKCLASFVFAVLDANDSCFTLMSFTSKENFNSNSMGILNSPSLK